jgi:hypothetical protein
LWLNACVTGAGRVSSTQQQVSLPFIPIAYCVLGNGGLGSNYFLNWSII